MAQPALPLCYCGCIPAHQRFYDNLPTRLHDAIVHGVVVHSLFNTQIGLHTHLRPTHTNSRPLSPTRAPTAELDAYLQIRCQGVSRGSIGGYDGGAWIVC